MQALLSPVKNLILVLIGIACCNFCHATIRYVKPGSAGTAPYTTWATASSDLQAVINQCVAGDEIWVAAGTYKPNRKANALTVITPTDRNNAFVIKNNVKIYGGFSAVETLLSHRNPIANVVTLSGDIGATGTITDNCYHVVIAAGISGTTTLLEGVSISSGNANASALTPKIVVNTTNISPRFGGGLYKMSAALKVINCIIRQNEAIEFGAGLYEYSSISSKFLNCSFYQNICAGKGGGVYITGSSAIFDTCAISNNNAGGEGGGAYFAGAVSPALTACTFSSNTASSNGGGICNYATGTPKITATILSGNNAGSTGGGIFNNNSPAKLTNCLINGNLAVGGGGIWNAFSNAVIVNCTIAANRSTAQGGAIGSGSSNPVLENCIVFGNTGVPASTNTFYNSGSSLTVDYSIIEGGYTGTGNFSSNPLFVGPVAAFLAPTTTGNYQLQKCSPALNAGNNGSIPPGIATDLAGNPRVSFATTDRGAYEMSNALLNILPDASGIVYVDYTKNGNGSSWASAASEFATALLAAEYNAAIKQIWVAKGVYKPQYHANDEGYISSFCPSQNRKNDFQFVDSIKLYGGFAGGETDTVARDFITNRTTLSGNIGSQASDSDNCYHVVVGANNTGDIVLDGFTITKGNANGTGSNLINNTNISTAFGGGLHNFQVGLAVANCTFTENTARIGGGGFYNTFDRQTITNCSFTNNSSGFGGGLCNTMTSPVINNCVFSYNTSATWGGGAIYNTRAQPPISNCMFNGNIANLPAGDDDLKGGGAIMYDQSAFPSSCHPFISNSIFIENTVTNGSGGAIFYEERYDDPKGYIRNCSFKGNSATGAGGALKILVWGTGADTFKIINCLMSGNVAGSGGGIYVSTPSPSYILPIINSTIASNWANPGQGSALLLSTNTQATFYNTVVWNNRPGAVNAVVSGLFSATYSNFQFPFVGGSNIFTNPLFVAPQAASSLPSSSGDYTLQPASPSRDAGSNALVPPGIVTDLRNAPRIINAIVDIGCYEFELPPFNNIVNLWQKTNGIYALGFHKSFKQ